jgi:hypothetical protein
MNDFKHKQSKAIWLALGEILDLELDQKGMVWFYKPRTQQTQQDKNVVLCSKCGAVIT